MNKKKSNVLAIGICFFLFAMISFVTGLQNPMGLIVKNQFGVSNAMSQLGNLANFIAYAFMGLPAGFILKRKGYKFTALAAVTVGFVGVAISYLSGQVGSFVVYLLGAFVSGFSMCMLNTVVNPMLNTLAGGGNKGNQLIQFAGSVNSLSATIVPVFAGYLIGDIAKASITDANPALFIAMGVFALAFVVLFFSQIPEPELEAARNKMVEEEESTSKLIKGALSYKHFVFGIIAIFLYVGLEVGVPNTVNNYLTTLTKPQLDSVIVNNTATCAEIESLKISLAKADSLKATAVVTTEVVVDSTMAAADSVKAEPTDLERLAEVVQDTVLIARYEKLFEDKNVEKIDSLSSVLVKETEKAQKDLANPDYQEGLGMDTALAGSIVGIYWLLMLCGRLIGGVVGGKVSSRVMVTFVSLLSIVFLSLGILFANGVIAVPDVPFPTVTSELTFGLTTIPLGIVMFVLCGLCTSVMWGAIFNLAVEGLGKYTSIASGLFMVMVCGGGVVPYVQGLVADAAGFPTSFWVLVGASAFILWFALFGSKVKKA